MKPNTAKTLGGIGSALTFLAPAYDIYSKLSSRTIYYSEATYDSQAK